MICNGNGAANNAQNPNLYYNPEAQQQTNSGIGQTLKSVGAMRLVAAATSTSKSLLNFALSNYGDYTGDYITQTKIDNTMSMLNTGMGIVNSTVMGFMAGGPAGAAIGLGISLIQMGTNIAQEIISTNISLAKTNYVASANLNRLGRILVDGSR